MKLYTVPPLEDPRDARTLYPQLEAIGYDGANRAPDPAHWADVVAELRRGG